MTPCLELNILIAEKIMGWTWDEEAAYSSTGTRYSRMYSFGLVSWWWVPKYSTDITAAWKVAEKIIKERQFEFEIRTWSQGQWLVTFNYNEDEYQAKGESPAHAICLAALRVVGIDLRRKKEEGISHHDRTRMIFDSGGENGGGETGVGGSVDT